MSQEAIDKLRHEALELSDAERAKLAYALVESLDAPHDADTPDAWDREIHRRLDQIEAGTAAMVNRGEFATRMCERLGSN